MVQGNKIISLLNTRLSYMKSVAAYKFENKLPIYVPEREEKLLQAARELAEDQNLSVKALENFVNTQMRVSVDIQKKWVEYWQQNKFGNDEPILDLSTEIRPKIKQVTQAISEELKALAPYLADSEVQASLKEAMHDNITTQFVTEAHKQALYSALINIK